MSLQTSAYSSPEGWPSDAELNQLFKVINEYPIDEALTNSLLDAFDAAKVPASDQLEIFEALTIRRVLPHEAEVADNAAAIHILTKETIIRVLRLGVMGSLPDGRVITSSGPYWTAWCLAVLWFCAIQKTQMLKELYAKWPILRWMLVACVTE